VLQPHVEEQRPFPVRAHLDQPGFERVELLVGDLVLHDDIVGGLDQCSGQEVYAFLRHVQVRELARGGEALGSLRAGFNGSALVLVPGIHVGLSHGGFHLLFEWEQEELLHPPQNAGSRM
jgi:hypothetical protein